MAARTILGLILMALASIAFSQADVEKKVQATLSQMTQAEKLRMLSGKTNFSTWELDRLGVPSLKLSDGPVGIRNYGPSTAYPAAICLAATWNPDLATRFGTSVGRDGRARGVHMWLAPGLNMARSPQNGRNAEYLGEDPILSSEMCVNIVKGVQSQGVIATLKHFLANDHENDRQKDTSDVDERTLHEIYMRPFEAGVEQGGAWAIMTGYNRVNGVHVSESPDLLQGVIQKEWGFKGFTVSDWGGTYSDKVAAAGLDLEMPDPHYMSPETIAGLLSSGKLTQEAVDDKLRRILRAIYSMGFDKQVQEDDSIPKDDPTSNATALDIAREGVVLLKNAHHILPIDPAKYKKIVVIGPEALEPYTGIGGSSYMSDIAHKVSIYSVLKSMLPPAVEMQAIPSPPAAPLTQKDWHAVATADLVIGCWGYPPHLEAEGHDRTFELPWDELADLKKTLSLNKRTIVVINSGGAFEAASWIGKAAALFHGWFPGQNGNQAVAEMIVGKTNPSAKLPISMPAQLKGTYYQDAYPPKNGHVAYTEGLFMGYRWFDANNAKPLFPFGFGLSYTDFELTRFTVSSGPPPLLATVRLQVQNVGRRAGAEVVQVYVGLPTIGEPRPKRELKGFQKIFLKPGESKRISIKLGDELKQWDTKAHAWVLAKGTYRVYAGTSSEDLPFQGTITVN